MERSSQLVGRRILALDTAAFIGEVKDVLFDTGSADVVGVTVRGSGLFSSPERGALPMVAVASVGRDAVMVHAATALADPDDRMRAALSANREVLHDAVVSDKGERLGTVTDVILRVDGASLDVVAYEIERPDRSRELVPLPDTFSVSSEALVVPADATRLPADDLDGLDDHVDRARRTS